jgi:type II secretory ATPase GspE/PulE/Tfp pilus assembly ATPase PilB-like protein/putative methionine-R-sulfoxide reductase with GAF domain
MATSKSSAASPTATSDAATANQEPADAREFERRLNEIFRQIHDAASFDEVLPSLEAEMLALLRAERMTVYQRGRHNREIVSRYKTGEEVKEIRVPVGPTSIAGYVALTKEPVRIQDVYDDAELKQISSHLGFDRSVDQRTGFRSRSMVVVPIVNGEVLLGVLQILNRTDGGAFNQSDLSRAEEIARIIGQKYRYDFRGTRGPFDHLVTRGHISRERLEELQDKGRRENAKTVQLLLEEAGLPPEVVGESLEHYYQVPFLAYDPDTEPPRELIDRFKRSYLRNNLIAPVAVDGNTVTLLLDNPNDTNRIMELQQFLGGFNFDIRVGLPDDILRYLGAKVDTAAANEHNLEDLVGKLSDGEVEDELDEAADDAMVDENEPTVVQLVNRLIVDAYKLGASDIHVEPGKGNDSSVVRMRVDGVCRTVLRIPSSHIQAVLARIKIMSRLDITERRKPQDGKISVKLKGQPVELRVATVPTVNGESAVMRLLASGGALPFDKLNLSERNYRETAELISHPHGLFLVVGPTGSGKTTTLHGVLGELNTPEKKIWTAEDPVEITQPGLQQVQVQPKIGFDFAAALRAFLRADPDVILIGEIRDQETAENAIEASLTGHMVFSTLHTNSAPETVTRLLDLGLDPMNFADSLLGVLAQRLMRTLCGDCKAAYTPDGDEWAHLRHAYGEAEFDQLGFEREATTLYGPKGCNKCGNTGYRGRTGIHELLVATPEMHKAIARSATIQEIRELAHSEGMHFLMQDGVAKILQGQSDLAQLRRVTAE